MGSNLVIVAIPADDDPIWKVSSEKKPHLTICFLGDAESNPNVDRIMLFVEHAVTIAARGPFYLEVDHRDVLGPDKADVLMFRKDWSFRWINQFRNQLLKDNDIRTAYESADQFPEWQPHITLGYPETPANENKIPEYGMSMIRFDRIGVWTGDFEGPDWRLEWPENDMLDEAAWGVDMDLERAAAGRYALEHVGVKGMHWGQRKTESVTVGGKSKMVTPRKAGKLDQKFEKNAASVATFIKVHNAGAEHVNSKIAGFNAAFEKKHPKEMTDGTLLNTFHPVTKEYHKAYNKMFIEGLNKGAAELGTNPTGTRKVKIMTENEDSITEFGWNIHTTKVAHAANDSFPNDILVYIATRDANGVITSVKPKETTLAQTDLVEEFMEHHGIKGMRWGQRKADVTSGAKAVAKGAGRAAKGAAKLTDDLLFESGKDNEHIRQDIAITAHNNLKEHDLPTIKAKHPVGGKLGNRLKKPLSPEAKAYRKDVKAAYLTQLESAANEHTNIQGNRRYTLKENGKPNTSQYFWDVSTESTSARHAISVPFRVRPIFDEEGYIVDFEYVPNEMAQTESFVDDYLVHYGIKGMHWGSRKSSEVTPTSVAVKTTPHDRKPTKVEVKGGGGHDAHPDAIKVAEARQKMRKSGTAALSNTELKDVADRLQLESNVTRLEGERKSGSTFVGKLLRKHGSQQLDRGINRAAGQVTDEAATRVGRAATKKVFKAGVAAAL